MVDGVEPLAHADAFPNLHLDLLGAQRLQQDERNRGIESGRVHPRHKKSLAHDGGEVALLDVEQVGQGEESAEAPSGLAGSLRVVESIDDGLVKLPIVVVHLLSSIK
eukprot:CAMPEP_0170468702 /NCGR_PEP_ID=MMETSP0123-20130129/11782_1 /TAXON_ID=182087 /ORGANISM="Favella ehrenbergii, Strain Fehren 1" /LENGTH=106 /DNA_ID=CAMNT_0010735335 /DNA_START=434 /DNA_END=754 /DNA_ORIENTATION=-